jgi:hypothetical protein
MNRAHKDWVAFTQWRYNKYRDAAWWKFQAERLWRPVASVRRAVRCSLRGNPSAKMQWRLARKCLRNDWGI